MILIKNAIYRISLLIASLVLLTAQCVSADSFIENQIENGIESGIYFAIKKYLIAQGKTPDQAECIVHVAKIMGTTDDVKGNLVGSLLDPEKTAEKLDDKFSFAEIICVGGTIGAIIFVAVFVGIFLGCCCACYHYCCKSKPTPMIIQLTRAMPVRNAKISYERLNEI